VTGLLGLAALAYWLLRRKRQGKPTLLDPDLFGFPHFRVGISQQMLQQITLGGAMIVLPIFLQMTLEYNAMQAGLSLAPMSLSMFAVAMLAGRASGRHRSSAVVCAGFSLTTVGMALIIPLVPRADFGWWLIGPLLLAGTGLGLLVSQLNNYTLAPIEEQRVSEAAGVNSAAGSFGLSFGLAVAGGVMLAGLSISFTNMTEDSTVIPPDQQGLISQALEEDAQIMSDAQIDALLADEPESVQEEILRINSDARDLSLQIALLVSVLASLIGLLNSLRMMRLPEITPSASLEGTTLG
jgi:MFS family permease